jgi:hypothetical protein
MASKIVRPPAPVHVVLVDTSILFAEDKAPPVDPKFDECWEKHQHLGKLELVIPDVVCLELHFQQATSALKARDEAVKHTAKVAEITHRKHTHRLDENAIRNQVGQKLDRWLSSKGGNRLPTPTSRIDWNQVIDASVWRKAPFSFDAKNKDNEKGFRDALILETLVDFVENDPRQVSFVFICADHLLQTSANQRLSSDRRFTSVESLDDFASFLKLNDEKLTSEFIRAILSRASGKFFTEDDPSCLYIREGVTTKILSEHAAEFEDPDSKTKPGYFSLTPPGTPTKWETAGSGQFWIRAAVFSHLVHPREYHWTSTVTFVRPYFGSNLGQSFFSPVGSEAPKEEWLLLLPFVVSWKATIKMDGRFQTYEVTKIDFKGRNFRPASEEEKKKYRVFGQPHEKGGVA